MPESDYHFNFFGRRAFTTPSPAILAYKSKCPVIVASIKREKGKYLIHYSDPIWPNLKAPMQDEIYRIMGKCLSLLEEKIKQNPGQWLWQHNRWKQDTPFNIYKRFRHDSILIILPKNLSAYLPYLKTFREIYSLAFITCLIPADTSPQIELNECEVLTYKNEKELFLKDFRFKIVFNFTNIPSLKAHFFKQSAFEVLNQTDLVKLAQKKLKKGDNFSLLLKKALTPMKNAR